LSLFAEDAKLVNIIKTVQDAINLQYDIDNLQIWCNLNQLFLNINKCNIMHYHLIKNPINYKYCISDFKIKLVSEFKDLGIIFDTKLNFFLHSETIQNKAMFNLGFI